MRVYGRVLMESHGCGGGGGLAAKHTQCPCRFTQSAEQLSRLCKGTQTKQIEAKRRRMLAYGHATNEGACGVGQCEASDKDGVADEGVLWPADPSHPGSPRSPQPGMAGPFGGAFSPGAPVRHASLGMGLGRIDPSEPGSDANRLLAIYLWRLQVSSCALLV